MHFGLWKKNILFFSPYFRVPENFRFYSPKPTIPSRPSINKQQNILEMHFVVNINLNSLDRERIESLLVFHPLRWRRWLQRPTSMVTGKSTLSSSNLWSLTKRSDKTKVKKDMTVTRFFFRYNKVSADKPKKTKVEKGKTRFCF